MSDVAIVGGGFLGLTLALRLSEDGHDVTVIEAAKAPGGLATAHDVGGYTWDRFYHVILLSDANLRSLLEELGLGDRLRWARTYTGFYVDDRLMSMSNALEFLRFPPLSLWSKARLALTILHASRIRNWRRLEGVDALAWLTRWSGRETVERIWKPLLKAKLGDNYTRVSAAFIWAIIARMYAARRSGLKVEMFGYVEGGYDSVLRDFTALLEARGVRFITGQPVRGIEVDDAVHLKLADGRALAVDNAVLTIPCNRILDVCPQLSAAERDRLERVIYQGVVCASVLLRRPLARYYVTNITDDWVPFTAVIEMTALVDPVHFDGNTLVYLPRYATRDDAIWQRSDESLREEFVAALERMYAGFTHDDVLAFRVARAREVQALSTLDYSNTALPPLDTSLPGVFIANSAQISAGTLNLNETIGLAEKQAARLRGRIGAAAVASVGDG
jgi:protoporphyrinogen oxidase